MESTARQLLAAIQSQPDNDAPRLAYASWLGEHGDPRSEFIRAQCELGRLTPSDSHYIMLRAQARALLAAHGAAWVGLAGSWVARVDDREPALLRLSSGPPDYAEIAVGFDRG